MHKNFVILKYASNLDRTSNFSFDMYRSWVLITPSLKTRKKLDKLVISGFLGPIIKLSFQGKLRSQNLEREMPAGRHKRRHLLTLYSSLQRPLMPVSTLNWKFQWTAGGRVCATPLGYSHGWEGFALGTSLGSHWEYGDDSKKATHPLSLCPGDCRNW